MTTPRWPLPWLLLALAVVALGHSKSHGQDAPQAEPPAFDFERPAGFEEPKLDQPDEEKPRAASPFGDPPGATRLTPKYDVWVDPKRKLVILDGEVCLREGQLEMFACPEGTKEHESIVRVNTKAFIVHAALLSLGAEPGRPVSFAPEYAPATGAEVEILVLWFDKEGNKRIERAQEWIRDVETEKPMQHNWVFAGSSFWTDETTGMKHYQAEAGDFICVSNFPTAMLDLPVESPQANQALLFEAFTEKIPPVDTKVRLVLRPKIQPKAAGEEEEAGGTEQQAEAEAEK